MIWAQLTSRRSLRDIESTLRAHSEKLFRFGMGKGISRNNVAYANANRNVAIYRDIAQIMMERASRMKVKDETLENIVEVFKLNGFFAIDSSSISLDLKKYPWSIPQKDYGGVKLHTMFDLLRGVPRMCFITGHEERDQSFMECYPYEPGCFYILDRLYFKTTGLFSIESADAFFITRIKRKVTYDILEEFTVDGIHILANQRIQFSGRVAKEGYPSNLRLIQYYSKPNNEVLAFVTNNFEVDAALIALLYKYRWQIELFFKWIKQHLRIINFYGTSANAVMIQIYTAITAFCALALLADNAGFKGSLYEFANIISVSLTEKQWIGDLIKRYNKEEDGSAKKQELPSLFDLLDDYP